MIYVNVQDASQEQYFSRNLSLHWYSKEDLAKLQDSIVTIIGVGGLGTVSAEQLSALGVGTLRLVDPDEVEFHNLPRQKLFAVSDVGKLKVEAARERLLQRNPFLRVQTEPVLLHERNVMDIIRGSDVIIDALDNFTARRILNKAAKDLNIPWVFGGATGSAGNALTITFKEGTPCFHCLYGDTPDNVLPTCETVGVYPPVLAMVANFQVMDAINILLGRKRFLEGKLLFTDLEQGTLDFIPVKARDDCPVCGKPSKQGRQGAKGSSFDKVISKVFGDVKIMKLCGHSSTIIQPMNTLTWDFHDVKQEIRANNKVIKESEGFIEFQHEGMTLRITRKGVITIKTSISDDDIIKTVDTVFQPISHVIRFASQ